MLKKTVTFINVDGVPVTRDLYFNLSSNELVEKEALSNQTYSEKLKEIAKSDKLSDIYPTIMEFIQDGYGVRTEDGDFEKSPEAWEKFKNSLAYQSLMDELLMNPDNNGNRLAEFINGMLPPDLVRRMQEQNVVPGFRPGANVSRPTPPIAGQQPTAGSVEAAPEPIVTPPAQPVQPAPAQAPQIPVEPTAPAPEPGVIQQTSEPRTPDLPQQY
jgi:hypothetical protein